MGRTYKRNDLHNSRRPKSIREKRQTNGSRRQTNYETDSTDFSTGNYKPIRPPVNDNDYEELQ